MLKGIVFIFVFFIYSNAFEISSNIEKYDLLNKSSIYIDYSKQLDFNQIKTKDFTQNSEKSLSFGYSPKFNVWIKFSLSNIQNNTIDKILEYENPLTTNIELYDSLTGLITKEGLFVKRISKRLIKRVSSKQIVAYKNDIKKLPNDNIEQFNILEFYYRVRLIIDYISGMTDDFALEEYQILSAIK